MREITLFLTLLISLEVIAADDPGRVAANPHMRCSAINYLLNSTPKAHDILPRQNFKLYMELHAKWAWVPYRGDSQKYKADYASTMRGLQEELNTKSLSGDAFAGEVENCISLQLRTMGVFMTCLHGSEATEANRQACANKAAGL